MERAVRERKRAEKPAKLMKNSGFHDVTYRDRITEKKKNIEKHTEKHLVAHF